MVWFHALRSGATLSTSAQPSSPPLPSRPPFHLPIYLWTASHLHLQELSVDPQRRARQAEPAREVAVTRAARTAARRRVSRVCVSGWGGGGGKGVRREGYAAAMRKASTPGQEQRHRRATAPRERAVESEDDRGGEPQDEEHGRDGLADGRADLRGREGVRA